MDVRSELESRFPGIKEDALTEAQSILRLYNLTPSDLWFKWEAFVYASSNSAASSSTKKEETLPFNLENLRELKKEIQATTAHTNNANVQGLKRENGESKVKKLGGRAALDGILDGFPSTPLAKKGRLAATPSSASTPLARGGFRPSAGSSYTPQAKSAIPSHLSRSLNGGAGASTPQKPGHVNGGPPGTPMAFDSPASSSAIKFEDRKNAGEIIESLNAHLPPIVGSATEASSSRVTMVSNVDTKTYNYRYMFEKLTERADVLDSTIDECAERIREYYSIEELGNPCFDSQEDMYCVGRICPENDGVKITETSVQFETSRRYGGGGDRCMLRFDPECIVRSTNDPSDSEEVKDGGAGLFPGLIMGVKGRNAGAGYFTVSEILMMPPADQPATPWAELIENQHGKSKLDGQPMSVVAACGPYTLDENLEYAPLTALLEEMSTLKPDILVLLGPFVDSSHPLIKSGDVDATPTQIFTNQVANKLSSFLEWSANTTVNMIPSPRDMISQHVAYPQAPFDREGLGLHKRCKMLPNPATFQVYEVVFAATSIDTLFAIKSQEYFKKAKDASSATLSSDADSSMNIDTPAVKSDPMARVCRHVLRQRSFYPLFPAPQQAPLDHLNLDVTHSNLLKFNQGTGADVFILPSMLKHFVKTVDSAVIINPSSLCRKNQPGTYAKLTIYPTKESDIKEAIESMEVDDEEDDRYLEHRLYERARVDIVRI